LKALIITYYWPPAGGSGVQRWLKFVKYLQEFGIEPVVYTVDNGNYPTMDRSLENDVPSKVEILKQSIWDPTDLLFWKKKKSIQKDVSNTSKGGFFSYVRGNFFIPDPKICWVAKSVSYLQYYIDSNMIDVIISTGPPHSMHLIAQKLRQNNTIKWIADFRDPWTNLYYHDDFKQGGFAKRRNKKLETLVLQQADCVLTVSATLQKEFLQTAKHVELVTNGFDDEVLANVPSQLDEKFTISYIGLLPKQSNPKVLFKVLKRLCKQDSVFSEDLQINFIGDISNEVRQELEVYDLISKGNFVGRVSHQKAIEYQHKAQVLLLLIPNVKESKGIVTGKLFEYLAAKRPILAIGPEDGDLSKILKDTNAGVVTGYENEEKLFLEIQKLYTHFKNGILEVASKNIEQFHRRKLTNHLATIIKQIVE
jgi:glycosyltransferase involved in cell wall biosynthesis